ncbi:amidase family protein [Streptomyces sp. NPDC001312]|uniref:amidase family protein n=1 Tax=Streptomyces sp. NPDC001312 TaxID=3364561 RepID=UPI00367B37AA
MTATTAGTAASPPAHGDLTALDALALSAAIRDGAVSCREVMQEFLARIDRLNPHVNAIIALRDEGELLAEAGERDRMLRRGECLGRLHGLPHAVKDLCDVAGLATTTPIRPPVPSSNPRPSGRSSEVCD